MQFKTRTREVKLPWNGEIEKRPEIQCPVCGEWFTNYRNQNFIRSHITKIAQSEAWAKELGEIKDRECKHIKFYVENTIRIRGKRIWKA